MQKKVNWWKRETWVWSMDSCWFMPANHPTIYKLLPKALGQVLWAVGFDTLQDADAKRHSQGHSTEPDGLWSKAPSCQRQTEKAATLQSIHLWFWCFPMIAKLFLWRSLMILYYFIWFDFIWFCMILMLGVQVRTGPKNSKGGLTEPWCRHQWTIFHAMTFHGFVNWPWSFLPHVIRACFCEYGCIIAVVAAIVRVIPKENSKPPDNHRDSG